MAVPDARPLPLVAGVRVGAYEILGVVGAGAMGRVYKARDTRLHRPVAIKILSSADPDRRRFEQEGRAIASLNHPHICAIYDVGPDYLVMEYVEGAAIAGPLPVDDAVRLALQIAAALEAAHRKGILHRDLKPANIIVGESGVKLLDFGLAKLVADGDVGSTQTAPGTVLGTAAYMAPEQAQGKPTDIRSEVFSFGAVLYELISGTRAFPGESIVDVLSAVLRDDPRPLVAPEAIARIVRRCLCKSPGERYQSIAEVRAALEQWVPEPECAPPSIAVLPFADMSADKSHEYFSDGLAEEILNALAQIRGLKVTARTSAFAFRGKDQDITKIAETLRVRTVLEGSVRRAGNRVRVTAQLINAADGYQLWSERYDRELTDIFSVQEEIAIAITEALQVKLGAERPVGARYKPATAAYEAVLKGRYWMVTFTPEGYARGQEAYEQAIALDPGYALAYTELGTHQFVMAASAVLPAREAMPLARAHAERALHIDATLSEAHAVLGVVAATYDYDWSEAGRRFRQAISRDVVPPFVRFCYAMHYLLPTGHVPEAIRQLEAGLQEDPLNLLRHVHLALCLAVSGREAESFHHVNRVLERDPNFWIAWLIKGAGELVAGRLADARESAEKAYAAGSWNAHTVGLLAGIASRMGDAERAATLVQSLGDGGVHGAPTGLIDYHLVRGDIDRAADWTAKAIEQRDPMINFLLRHPLASALRASPRWPALAAAMNLPG